MTLAQHLAYTARFEKKEKDHRFSGRYGDTYNRLVYRGVIMLMARRPQ